MTIFRIILVVLSALSPLLAGGPHSQRRLSPEAIEALEAQFAGSAPTFGQRLGLTELPLPKDASSCLRITHSRALSDMNEALTLWVSASDTSLHVHYRAPFLVGWLRQVALLNHGTSRPSVEVAAARVRMIDYRLVVGPDDTMDLRRDWNRLRRLVPAGGPRASTVQKATPVVDGCGLQIVVDDANGKRGPEAVRDLEIDDLVEALCLKLRNRWIHENLGTLRAFLGKEGLKRLGPDLLTRAFSPSDLELAKALLALGVDPSNPASDESYPLVEACGAANQDLVKCLLAKGASPNKGSHSSLWPEHDLMPLDTALNAVEQALPDAAEIVRILLEHGADPNVFGSGYGSPLSRAKKSGNTELVTSLINGGAKTQ